MENDLTYVAWSAGWWHRLSWSERLAMRLMDRIGAHYGEAIPHTARWGALLFTLCSHHAVCGWRHFDWRTTLRRFITGRY